MSVQDTKDKKEEKPEEIKPEDKKPEQVKKTRSSKSKATNASAKSGSETVKKTGAAKSAGSSSGAANKTNSTGQTRKRKQKTSDPAETEKKQGTGAAAEKKQKADAVAEKKVKTESAAAEKKQKTSTAAEKKQKADAAAGKKAKTEGVVAAEEKQKEDAAAEEKAEADDTVETKIKPEEVPDKIEKPSGEKVQTRQRKSSAPDIVAPVTPAEIEITPPTLDKPEEPKIFSFDDAIFTDEEIKLTKDKRVRKVEAGPEVVAEEAVEAIEPEIVAEEIAEEVAEAVEPEVVAEEVAETIEPEVVAEEAVETVEPEVVAEEVAEEADEAFEPDIAAETIEPETVEEEVVEAITPEIVSEEADEAFEPDIAAEATEHEKVEEEAVETVEPEVVAEETAETVEPGIVAKEAAEEAAEAVEPEIVAEEADEAFEPDIAAETIEPETVEEEAVEEVAIETVEPEVVAEETAEPQELKTEDGNFFTKLFAGLAGKKDKQPEAAETVEPEIVAEEVVETIEQEETTVEAAEAIEPEALAGEAAEEADETVEPDIAAETLEPEAVEEAASEDIAEVSDDEAFTLDMLESDVLVPKKPQAEVRKPEDDFFVPKAPIAVVKKPEDDFFVPKAPKAESDEKTDIPGDRLERKLVERRPERRPERGSDKRRDPRRRRRRRRGRKRIGIVGNIVRGLFAALAVLIMIGMGFGVSYVYGFVKDLPTHDLDEIEASLKVLSTIYDDEGNEMTDICFSDSRRELITYEQLPENLINAMVAIEDKTFWQHKGFNITRMLGALREAYTGGGDISGTSTITQQLARNIWLAETRSEYSLERKLKEAWFARELEQNLTKEEILTHYLNMVALGNHSYGVAAAAKLYFNKDLSELDLLECAALAALPQSPSRYAMIITVPPGYVDPNDPDILLTTDEYIFLYNREALPRIQLVLDLMYEQGYITEVQHRRASNDNIRRHLHPQPLETYDNSAFFLTWMINNVAEDLVSHYPNEFPDTETALQLIYSGGLEIYSTYSQRIQSIATEEFEDPKNYPVAYMVNDKSGNARAENGDVILYNYNNMFVNRAAPEETQEQALEGEDPDAVPSKFDLAGIGEPWFKLKEDEFEILPNGGMRIFAGKDKRLGIYHTSGDWGEDISIEFKDFFTKPPGSFYIVKGGRILIPAEYKKTDGHGNLILGPEFFESKDNVFTFVPFEDDEGNPTDEVLENGAKGEYWIGPENFILEQPVVQPQGATVILEYETGQVKAMIGGRGIEGSMQYNRALSPRQPGSTMKPIGVYGPALQKTAEGIPVNDPEESFGLFWTAVSVIYDEPLEYGGRVWPKNWYSGYRGPVTMRRAIEQSMNVCAVRSQLAVGNQRSIDFLKKLGITTIVETGIVNDLNPSALALGGMTLGIKPLELASAYSTFPNGGVHVRPIGYTKVLYKNGEMLLDGTPESEQVMDPGAAYIMTDMLRTTVQNGISNAGRIQGMEVSGKTGTTSENVDAWFAGSVNKYTAAVWIGNDTVIEMSKGSAAAAALYSKMMGRVCEGMEPVLFSERPMPPNVEKGSVGGITDYFLIGTRPDALTYGTKICVESGMLATPMCPETERIALRPLNGHPANLTPEEIAEADGNIPIWYCPLHNPDPLKYPIDPNPEPPPPPPPPVCLICGDAHDTSAHPPPPICGICYGPHETHAHPPDPKCIHGVSPPGNCAICYPPPPVPCPICGVINCPGGHVFCPICDKYDCGIVHPPPPPPTP